MPILHPRPHLLGALCGNLVAGLVAGGMPLASMEATPAQVPQPQPAEQALAHVLGTRPQLGLNVDHSFKATHTLRNPYGQTAVRLQQYFQNVKVLGGEVIVRCDRQGKLQESQSFARTVALSPTLPSVTPSLDEDQALAIATKDVNPTTDWAFAPKMELLVFQDDGRRPTLLGPSPLQGTPGWRLAYRVHTTLEAENDIRYTDYLIDAQNGHILKRWNALQTATPTASGKGFYAGDVTLDVSLSDDGTKTELRDQTRGTQPHPIYPFAKSGNLFLNMRHLDDGSDTYRFGGVYTNAPGSPWGDGSLYNDDGTTDTSGTPSGQSVAVDAYIGTAATWDFYTKILGWAGVDNMDSAAFTRIHIGHNYANAFWSDDLFGMSYGDGSLAEGYGPLTTVDIAAHEISHGVTFSLGGLDYVGESGGLNESFSDIFGKLVDIWYKGGQGTTVPATLPAGVDWTFGKCLIPDPSNPGDPSTWLPLRSIIRPSWDWLSADFWTPGIGNYSDVHYSSGPLNRFFYFLTNGASTSVGADNYSPFFPDGFTGIDLDTAAKLLFTTRQQLTSTATYAEARTTTIAVADGIGVAAGAAVRNAFAAINVGPRSSTLTLTRNGAASKDTSLGGMFVPGSSATFTASTAATWSLLEPAAGTLSPNADGTQATFTAGGTPGIYHINASGSGATNTFAVTIFQPDVDGDGVVDAMDFGRLAYAECTSDPALTAACDLNGDGIANQLDTGMFDAAITGNF